MRTTLLLVAWACALFCASAQKIDPWYDDLRFFGGCSSWQPSKMVLVADHTYRIANITCKKGDEYMFVNHNRGPPYPPLGGLNWKQGKIGIGAFVGERSGVWTYRLLPGGGGGRHPVTATYTMTLHTSAHPTKPELLEFQLSGALPAATLFAQGSSVSPCRAGLCRPLVLGLSLTEPVRLNAGQFTVTNGRVSSLRATGPQAYQLTVQPRAPGVVDVTLPKEALVSAARVASDSGASFRALATASTQTSRWNPLTTLRDTSGQFKRGREPSGGWYVTPIHGVTLVDRGHVLISGFLRRDALPCRGGPGSGGRRQAGISFRLDPAVLRGGNNAVRRVNEDGEYPFEGNRGLVQDGQRIQGDAIYCSGHTTLADGRIFYVGGARYAQLSGPDEYEFGLDYARIYDPRAGNFQRISARIPLGRAWYPTAGLLADGRVLVTGGFSDWGTSSCLGDSCLNPRIDIFDPAALDKKANPWTIFIDKANQDHDIDPGAREYTRVFALPTPVQRGGYLRDVLLMGKWGKVVLASTDPKTPMNQRLFKPPGGARPDACETRSEQSTFVPLVSRGGEVLVIGGCPGHPTAMSRIDRYNVVEDKWYSYQAGIGRGVPAATILPNGNVLIVSGENGAIDQIASLQRDAPLDPRYAQIFDPMTGTVTTDVGRAPVFRGYHNMAVLLRDGSVLVGGGFNALGDVGCENPTIQTYQPSYGSGPRPRFLSVVSSGQPTCTESRLRYQGEFVLVAGARGVVLRKQGKLHNAKGVALLFANAFTHSYDQSQRYVPLTVTGQNADTVSVDIPPVPVTIPGMYRLFLLSADGVPSVAVGVQVIAPCRAGSRGNSTEPAAAQRTSARQASRQTRPSASQGTSPSAGKSLKARPSAQGTSPSRRQTSLRSLKKTTTKATRGVDSSESQTSTGSPATEYPDSTEYPQATENPDATEYPDDDSEKQDSKPPQSPSTPIYGFRSAMPFGKTTFEAAQGG